MSLLTKSQIKKIPNLYATESTPLSDKLVMAKIFHPSCSWTWYVIEFDGRDTCWGLVSGHENEFGYFSLSEISQAVGPLGLTPERDRWFNPTRVGDLEEFTSFS
jgi:hypothetical protein